MQRLERQARNEALLRHVNDRVATLDRRAEGGWAAGEADRFEFHCECGAPQGCPETLALTLDEYERVRREVDRFVVAPGHETPEIERTVERREGYLVVDKLDRYEPSVGVDDSPSDT